MAWMKDECPDRRKKILAAAEAAFSERGFDGARVDDIAGKAGVNKALIYYYFKSKDDILDELFNRFITRALERSAAVRGRVDQMFSDADMRAYFLSTLEFLEENKNLLRIIMMESLKKTDGPPLLIKALAASRDFFQRAPAAEIIEEMRRRGVRIEDGLQPILVNEFFTLSVPAMLFVLFQKAWTDHFEVKEGDLREWFLQALGETHLAYHRRAK